MSAALSVFTNFGIGIPECIFNFILNWRLDISLGCYLNVICYHQNLWELYNYVSFIWIWRWAKYASYIFLHLQQYLKNIIGLVWHVFVTYFGIFLFKLLPVFLPLLKTKSLYWLRWHTSSSGVKKKNKEEREQRFREPELAQGVNGTDAPMVPSSPLSSFERLKEIFMLNKSNCHTFRPPQS